MSVDRSPPPASRPGVWLQAWMRLKNDRCRYGVPADTRLFIAGGVVGPVGLVAKDWQKEVGMPRHHRTLLARKVTAPNAVVARSVAAPT